MQACRYKLKCCVGCFHPAANLARVPSVVAGGHEKRNLQSKLAVCNSACLFHSHTPDCGPDITTIPFRRVHPSTRMSNVKPSVRHFAPELILQMWFLSNRASALEVSNNDQCKQGEAKRTTYHK
eukprot:1541082-Amphidinium_carterae.1